MTNPIHPTPGATTAGATSAGAAGVGCHWRLVRQCCPFYLFSLSPHPLLPSSRHLFISSSILLSACATTPTHPPTPLAPIATPALTARSTTSAAKVALQPLGVIPYDGMTLPLVAPDGFHLATQLTDNAIAVYNFSRLPASSVRTAAGLAVVLASAGDNSGFFVFTLTPDAPPAPAKCLFDAAIIAADHPSPDSRVAERIEQAAGPELRLHALASISHNAVGAVLCFDPTTSRMSAWMPGEATPIPLAPGSIAGCWLSETDGSGVLLTTNEGLVLQRIFHTLGAGESRDGVRWRVSDPVRLLREPFVPRATNNPDRPYILIGPAPGTAEHPYLLQIAAMRLVEE